MPSQKLMYSIGNKQLLRIFENCRQLKSITVNGIEINDEANKHNYLGWLKEKQQLHKYKASIAVKVDESMMKSLN